MVTWVRGMFKDVHGRLEMDFDDPCTATFEAEIDATKLWTGEPERDAHLRSAAFFDVEEHPTIQVRGRFVEQTGSSSFKAVVATTVRGTTLDLPLDVVYHGLWETPFWVAGENKGTLRRIGFEATTRVDRHDFGVSWQDELPKGGVVASNEIDLRIDVEAILDEDLERTGAIGCYRAGADSG